ncbi:Erythromycin esterase [Pleurostoma richardsiae]|uniref:Erythromycin esterase n=1 Tax=Pleurostoma richardsiae TaxID=41990 RepID=A0AA38RPC2_9PEZI|nr:Erythromycin esterase [Pleurostoma richardsiae]
MSPARRRSARLASASSMKTPKAKRTATQLSAVTEGDESASNTPTQSLNALLSSPMPPPKTPADSSPVKPGLEEMHPSKVHATMAPPSSALRLGFTDIRPSDSANGRLAFVAQSTPTKSAVIPSPLLSRSDLGLGSEVQEVLKQIREDAAKIKVGLAAELAQKKAEEEQVNGRKLAKPKGRAGRFSAAHMAEFKKMDSIKNHPSAFRAGAGRATPVSKGVKRTQSKANLTDSDRAAPPSTKKIQNPPVQELDSPAKRARKHFNEDASTNRPVSRDGSFIPRPATAGKDVGSIPRSHSTLSSLMTPTKSSLARLAGTKTPTTARSMIKSPSKPVLGSGLKKSATMHDLGTRKHDEADTVASVQSPGRLERVKSIFGRQKSVSKKPTSAIPMPSAISRTPAPPRLEKDLPPLPLTTPGRKLPRPILFTPETKRAALLQNSPSPIKSCAPSSKTSNTLVQYPSLDAMMSEEEPEITVHYPDLSAARPLPEPPAKTATSPNKLTIPDSNAPGNFTFRSDQTIRFASSSPSGFGSSPGQVSVRPVRPSILPTADMPGSFPSSVMSRPNKENEAPEPIFDLKAVPHGMINKKRHRVTDDEEEAEQEAAERAAKKRRAQPVPEGEALVAPRLLSAKKGLATATPRKLATPRSNIGTSRSPAKKPVLSLSRLNMLARPKYRK